eukprot:15351841-Ditylum_brightwellii.AAC.1
MPKPYQVFTQAPMKKWTVEDVSNWLGSIGMAQYSSAFASSSVDGAILHTITEEDLTNKYGVKRQAHQKRIIKRIAYAKARVLQSSSALSNETLRGKSSNTIDEKTGKARRKNDVMRWQMEEKTMGSLSISLYIIGV